ETLWKKTLILMDNHTLWQCHNYAAHYLPQSFKLAEEAQALEATLLGSRPNGRNAVIFNPTPWTRDITVQDGGRDLVAKAVPGWGARVVSRASAAPRRKDTDPFTLSNDLATFRLNREGETVEIQNSAARSAFDGLGRVLRIHEQPSREAFTLAAGHEIKNIEGALEATAEVELPNAPASELHVTVPDITGAAFLMRVERIAASGAVIETAWVPLHSLHWGGAGMPRAQGCVGPRRFAAAGARRVRVTLWLLAQGSASLAPLRVWMCGAGDRFVESPAWRVRVLYRNAYTPLAHAKARVLHSSAAIKTVRFTGALPGARCHLDATLRAGSAALEYTLRLAFPRPTALGLSTPPLGEDEGSFLGAQCERPYVPGLAVLFPLPRPARYFVDQPAFIRQALRPSPRTWHTDQRDWWLGMSPFIGMNLAAADFGAAQLGLLTRGLKHFFRWRRAGAESLGLSLGATLIHPMTQGHSVPPSSPWYDILKRASHNPYFKTPFLRVKGEYVFHYAVQLAPSGQAAAFDLWKAAQEFALPSRALPVAAPPGAALPGVEAAPSTVVITAVEPDGPRLRLRLVNMAPRKTLARIRLPFDSRPVAGAARLRSGAVEIPLAPWALREVVLERVRLPETKDNV
ncbi:MAG TPA: hypothetical protein P5137_10955, partial [Candidatus Brocadiia bacterium]|nr:hypothetical protein [Candidatus Brocadiia bacterium]